MTISEAVGALADEVGSLEKLAASIKVSWHAVYSWKKGFRTPSKIHRGELADLAEKRSMTAVARALRQDIAGEARA